MALKIAITYEKGGCGKTTTAVNLAAILAERGYKTLLVDLDFQSYATSYYNIYNDDNQPTIYEVMQGIVSPEKAICKSNADENLEILPSAFRMKGIETFLMMKTKRQEYTLKSVIQPIDEKYEFILFDCPPNGERIKENALTASDYLILPIIPDDFAIHGFDCITRELAEVKQFTNPNLKLLGILITLYENTANKKAYTAALQQQSFLPCLDTVIRKNTTLSEAINAHKPINKYKKSCNGSKDYYNLCNEILLKIGKEKIKNGN